MTQNLNFFEFLESHDAQGNGPVLELQEKVTLLGNRVKGIPVIQTLQDIHRLNTNLAALTNKVGLDGLNVPPRNVIAHMESILTHVENTNTK